MNHNEIESCVIRAKTGSQEDILKLIEQFKPFIVKTANDFHIRNHDFYDMLQLGYVAVLNAVDKYRVGTHTFASYAYSAIKNTFRYEGRKHAKASKDLSMNLQIATDEEIGAEYIDFLEDDFRLEEEFIKAEDKRELRKALQTLSEEQLELVIMVYYSQQTLKAYAEKKGISIYMAKKRKRELFEKLRGIIKT